MIEPLLVGKHGFACTDSSKLPPAFGLKIVIASNM